jgi:hypothetical protein
LNEAAKIPRMVSRVEPLELLNPSYLGGEVDGNSWRVRINDFPDELTYNLMIGSENAGDFHDWPGTWQRSSDA